MSTEITKVDKRGEHYHVEGYVKGRKASFHVTAQGVEERFKTTKDQEAFFKRSLPDAVERRD